MTDYVDPLVSTGLDIVQAGATYAGLHTLAIDLGDGSAMLAYELHDGTAFVVRGRGRNDYSVARVNLADDPLNDRPTHYDDRLNLAEVVRILTFARPLPPNPMPPCQNYSAAGTRPTTARKRWLLSRS